MAGFAEIIGHEQIIEHLQNAILSQKVSHAYILNGPDDSGKKMIAEAVSYTHRSATSSIEKANRSSLSVLNSTTPFLAKILS